MTHDLCPHCGRSLLVAPSKPMESNPATSLRELIEILRKRYMTPKKKLSGAREGI